MKKNLVLLFLILASANILYSQEIITDRPDRTESVETVGKNRLQIETGMEYTFFKSDLSTFYSGTYSLRTVTLPTTLVRFGILKNVELRFGFDFDFMNSVLDQPSQPGLSSNQTTSLALNPPTIGAKVHLYDGKGTIPAFAIIGAVTIPNVGADYKQTKYLNPEFVLCFSNDINEQFGLGYNLGVEFINADDEFGGGGDEQNYFYSASLGISLTPKLGTFIEIFGNFPTNTISSDQNIDGGFTYLIQNNIQVDAYGGLGLSSSSNNFMLGTGIAFKF